MHSRDNFLGFILLRRFRSIAVVGLMALAGAFGLGQRGAGASPAIHGLAHVAIRVNDLAVSRAFYEKLGFEQPFDLEKNGVVTESFIKVNDRQFIELYPKAEGQPEGFLHLCFDGDDLEALYQFDVKAGLTPTAVRKAGAGNLLFTLRGPEDQNIEYTQYMPGSRHFEDRGKHLGAKRIADNFFAVGLGMKDVAAAKEFYTAKLGFSGLGSKEALLLLPGSPNQQILLEPLMGTRARIFLHVLNLKRAEAELKLRGIAFTGGKQELTVTDPDGNLLVFTGRQTAE